MPDSFVAAPPKDLLLDEGFRFVHGQTIAPFTIRYETFGELNAEGSNAILVCHALSASAHAAGKYRDDPDEKPGWWDGLIGYRKGIDLQKYFVICANLPGSCFGTTAPSSIDPANGRHYGSRFPWPTIEDMVHSQKVLLDRLGITRLRAVAGGSLGGMQVLMWAALYPDFMDSIITMAAGAAVPVQGVAWHVIGRKMIESDARFNGGDYYDHPEPLRGLQVARMVGHMTYLSAQALQSKFGRRRRGNTRQFEIDSYFEHQGRKFAAQYDANSYIRVQAAMDEMDLEEKYGSLQEAFAKWRGRTLLVSFDTDWLFPVSDVERVESAMVANGTDVQHERIASTNGHDTFLIDYNLITPPVTSFLASLP
ncbi:MAG TPA: homoserine O-acetyltransferase [Thermoanaerobaculia bacterium]|jgi:homoserine O-acetyltransferase|nr:homoserine O-acetyltransferase [Thermoanaerobaculia bacterium]